MHPPKIYYDVLIIGSGSAGLSAALTTSAGGLKTLILEKSNFLGGTSAISGAGVWVPANHHALSAGIDDTPEEALKYIMSVAPAGWKTKEYIRWQRFVFEAPKMLKFLEQYSPLKFVLTPQADPMHTHPGAKPRGRMLSPKPLSKWRLGKYRRMLTPPELPLIFTYQEVLNSDPFCRPLNAVLRYGFLLLQRWFTSTRGMGAALIIGLLRGCLDHGCHIKTRARAVKLIKDKHGCIIGAQIDHAGKLVNIYSRVGVVIASGGFEWDRERLQRHFPGPIDFIASPKTNEGDGHRMAEQVGAKLAHMDQANLSPGVPSGRNEYPHGQSIYFHRVPNSIIVNYNGKRFLNEYSFNLGTIIDRRDTKTGMPVHLPAWFITDAFFLNKFPLIRLFARKMPRWMIKASSLKELAELTGLPVENLKETVKRYHSFCASGVDLDFGRNELTTNKSMETITRPPFIAIPFNRTFVSTKGGPVTNHNGQVIGINGQPIGGLYCAGVAMDNPFGTWAVGAGTTLGPNMTWGYICGHSLLAKSELI